MSNMHGENSFGYRNFLEKLVNTFLMQGGFEEILKFRKHLLQDEKPPAMAGGFALSVRLTAIKNNGLVGKYVNVYQIAGKDYGFMVECKLMSPVECRRCGSYEIPNQYTDI